MKKNKFNIPIHINKYSINDLNYINHYCLDYVSNKPTIKYRNINNKSYCIFILIKPTQCTNK
jgi:hypothetical protein